MIISRRTSQRVGGRNASLKAAVVMACLALILGAAPDASAAKGDVFFDRMTTDVTDNAGSNTLTFTHVVTNTVNRYLVVSVSICNCAECDWGDAADSCEVESITYAGTNLIERNSDDSDDAATRAEQWYLSGPASGTNSVIITMESSGTSTVAVQFAAAAVSFYNAKQGNETITGSSCFSNSASGDYTYAAAAAAHRNGCTDVVAVPTSGTRDVSTSTLANWQSNEDNSRETPGLLTAFSTAPASRFVFPDYQYLFVWDIDNEDAVAAHCAMCVQPPPPAPTFARLIDFTALETDFGTILRWRTDFEVENLGFRVWREDADGRVPVNQDIIAGSALFAGVETRLTAGRSYALWDVSAESTTRYWLEDVDLNGLSSWRGPFVVEIIDDVDLERLLDEIEAGGSPSLDELTVPRRSVQQPRVAELSGERVGALQWDIAASHGAKLEVEAEGWYRVTRADLVAAGFDPGHDATNLQLIAEGEEFAVKVTGQDDGFFDMNDAVEFYGLGIDTPASDAQVYWLTIGAEPGRRIESVNPMSEARRAVWADHFPYTLERRDRTIYFAALTENGGRDNFYGAIVSSTPVDQVFSLDAMPTDDRAGMPVELEIALQGVTSGQHRVEIALNGTFIGEMVLVGREALTRVFTVDSSFLLAGDNTVTLTSLGIEPDVSLVDSIRLTYERDYSAKDGILRMTAEQGESLRVSGFSSPSVRLMDVSDPANVVEFAGRAFNSGMAGVSFVSVNMPPGWLPGQNSTLFAFSQDRIMAPLSITANTPSEWNATSNDSDFVIITNAEFASAAQRLADHREAQGFEVAVVDITDVYDEFSFGIKNPKAIREFLDHAVAGWSTAPQWVLLFGDGTFDPRNFLGFGDFDFVPTTIAATEYLKTAIDDQFVPVGPLGDLRLALGRIPVRVADDAETVVDKLIAYDSAVSSDHVALIAGENDGTLDFEGHVEMLAQRFPAELDTEQFYLGQIDASLEKQTIMSAFDDGSLVVGFTGHGSVGSWSSAGSFGVSDVAELTNQSELPLVLALNCFNGAFQDVYQQSLAEALLSADNGGAAAVLSSSALTTTHGQLSLNAAVLHLLFDGTHRTIGEALMTAKTVVENEDVRNTFMLFGDPTMRLNR